MFTDQMEGCTPIRCIVADEWAAYLDQCETHERQWLSDHHLKVDTHPVVMVPNFSSGHIDHVLIIAQAVDKPTLLAPVVKQLPEGHYRFEGNLSSSQTLYWALAQYRFDRFRSQASEADQRLLYVDPDEYASLSLQLDAMTDVRDLINLPTNALGPSQLSKWMAELALNCGADFEEIVGEALLDKGFPAIHAVGRAAAQAPRLLKMTWGADDHPCVALVGKGVCFDSGGLDIKPSGGMRLMKKDMGGAAHVLGLAKMIMMSGLPLKLVVLVPAVENSISSDAYRPGDIIATRKGQWVEIDNTDAEGRLILADAITYAQEHQPQLLIDMATLTGAARAAVGTDIAAFFSNQQPMTAELMTVATEVDEALWPMPLHKGYRASLNSPFADIGNCGSSHYAGAVTAALFLQTFVDDKLPWLHFDIMAYNPTSRPGHPQGGEAMALRSLFQYLLTSWCGE